jgi:hypothetical protein
VNQGKSTCGVKVIPFPKSLAYGLAHLGIAGHDILTQPLLYCSFFLIDCQICDGSHLAPVRKG